MLAVALEEVGIQALLMALAEAARKLEQDFSQ